MPPIWYQVHLTAPGWNVKGFTLPGAPMIIIGHNDRIAWGLTNNGADVQDLYVETFNPASPDAYRVKGAWAKAQIIDETILIKGQPDEHLKITVTRSEEHTSELQSRLHLVCRLLLEKKKNKRCSLALVRCRHR